MFTRQPLFIPSIVVRRNCRRSSASIATGVGNNPNPFPPVRRANTRSRQNIRPDLVPCSFQVSLHLFEDHSPPPIKQPENIFANHPTRSNLLNDSTHLRPQIAVIRSSFPFSRDAEGLARESAGKYVNSPSINSCVEFPDISIQYRFRPIKPQNPLTEFLFLTLEHILPPYPRRRQIETSDPTEQTAMPHTCLPFSLPTQTFVSDLLIHLPTHSCNRILIPTGFFYSIAAFIKIGVKWRTSTPLYSFPDQRFAPPIQCLVIRLAAQASIGKNSHRLTVDVENRPKCQRALTEPFIHLNIFQGYFHDPCFRNPH